MTDTVDALATDYQEARLRTFPTWAHLIGDYRYVDQFEEVSREAEDAQIAESRGIRRASRRRSRTDGLSADERITREMVAWDATARADFAEARTRRVRRRPDLRGAGVPPGPDPEADDPRRGHRRGLLRQAARHRDVLPRPGRPPPRGRRERADAGRLRRPPDDRAAGSLARRRRSPTTRSSTPPSRAASRTSRSGRAAWRRSSSGDVRPAVAGLPRHAPRPGPAPRPPERQAGPLLGRRRRRGLRERDPLLHDGLADRPGDPRHRPRPGRVARPRVPDARAGRRRDGRPARRSTRHSATTPRSTITTPTRSSPHRRPRWPRPAPRWATGSGSCRRPTATSRRRRTARSPTTSRRRRTAAAAASSS